MKEEKALDLWLDNHTSLFLFDVIDAPVYLDNVEVEYVEWEESLTLRRLAPAEIILCGYLPKSSALVRLKDGTRLEVTYAETGPYDEYEVENVLMRFLDCKVIKRRIERPVAIDHSDCRVIPIRVTIHCLLEMLH